MAKEIMLSESDDNDSDSEDEDEEMKAIKNMIMVNFATASTDRNLMAVRMMEKKKMDKETLMMTMLMMDDISDSD